MDLYAYADGDPINGFDADGRFVSGVGNGIGRWGSDLYAGLGNALDFVLQPFARFTRGTAYAETHFGGGYEADPSYSRNFEHGSTAYQMGHVGGYIGAEIGFNVGLGMAAKGFGTLARAAATESAELGALERYGAGAAGAFGEAEAAASAERGAWRAGAEAVGMDAGLAGMGSRAMAMGFGRAGASASMGRMFSSMELGGWRGSSWGPISPSPGAARLTSAGSGMANFGAGGGRTAKLNYDSQKSFLAMMELVFKRGQAYGFIKGDKVQIIR